MKSTDTFARVLGTDWQHEHWYTSARERNAALKDMASQHLYSRNGDLPTLIFEPIERDD